MCCVRVDSFPSCRNGGIRIIQLYVISHLCAVELIKVYRSFEHYRLAYIVLRHLGLTIYVPIAERLLWLMLGLKEAV